MAVRAEEERPALVERQPGQELAEGDVGVHLVRYRRRRRGGSAEAKTGRQPVHVVEAQAKKANAPPKAKPAV